MMLKCLLCGSDNVSLKYDGYPGYRENDLFRIIHCNNCDTSFSTPRINDSKELYDIIYRNASSIPGYSRYWNYYKNIKSHKDPLKYLSQSEAAYWGVNESLQKIVSDKNSTDILEVGSGLGYLTYALINSGYKVKGLDISPEAVNQANKYFGEFYICDDLFNFSKSNTDSFDVIILTELIEHINEPEIFFENIFKVLKTGGSVILTTPNKSFYPQDIVWETECPPIHCWWFSEKSIEYIAGILNAKVSFVDFSDFYRIYINYCDLKYLRSHPLRSSVLDSKSSVKKPKTEYGALMEIVLLRLINKFPFSTSLKLKIMSKINPNLSFFSNSGNVLCAILKKNDQISPQKK